MVNNPLPPTQTSTPRDQSVTDLPAEPEVLPTGSIAGNSALGDKMSADKSLDVE